MSRDDIAPTTAIPTANAPAEENLSTEAQELKRLVPGADQLSPGQIQALLIAQGAVTGENVPQSLRGQVAANVPEANLGNKAPSTAVDGQVAQAAKVVDSNSVA